MTKRSTLIVTFALLLSNMMAGLDGTIINTALPAIISDLHGIEYLGWIVAVFLLGMAVATPLWSKLGERIGNRSAYQIATTLFAIGAILQAISGNIIFFLISRTLMGIGAGGMNTLPFIIYADLYKDLRARARVIGYATASFSAASIIGPLVGGWIVDTFSWHWVFYINIPLALISILSVRYFFKETVRERQKGDVDYLGASVMVVGLVTLLTGIQLIGTGSLALIVALLAIGVFLIWLLFRIEARAKDPIVPNRLFKNQQLVIDFVLFVVLWGAFIAFNIYVPMWAQGILGLSALLGGMTQIPGAFTNLLGSVTGPAWERKIGKYRIIAVSTLMFMVAFVGLVLAGKTIPFWFLLAMGAFEGFGLGMSFNVLQISVQEDAEERDVPIATSFAYLLRILSQTFMSSIYGVILNQALTAGVANSGGKITMNMMNKLSNNQEAVNLPTALIPQMRDILYAGIHNIMLLAVALLVIVLTVTIWLQLRAKKVVKLATKPQ